MEKETAERYNEGNSTKEEKSIEELSQLSTCQLQEYCIENPNTCEKEEFWRVLLAVNYPELHSAAMMFDFPDVEASERAKERIFSPLRELYMQLLAVSEHAKLFGLVTAIINEKWIGYYEKETTEFFRTCYALSSLLLASLRWEWKKYLIAQDDPLVRRDVSLTDDQLYDLSRSYLKSWTSDWLLLINTAETLTTGDVNLTLIGLMDKHAEMPPLLLETLFALPQFDPHFRSRRYFLLGHAAKRGHLAVVRHLVENAGVDPAQRRSDALRSAAENGHLAVVELLLSYPRVDLLASNSLVAAAKGGHAEVVKRLLRCPEVSKEFQQQANEALYVASGMPTDRHATVVGVLLHDGRAHAGHENFAAIHTAAKVGAVETMRQLVLSLYPPHDAADIKAAVRIALVRGFPVAVVSTILADTQLTKDEIVQIMREFGSTKEIKWIQTHRMSSL